MARPKRWKNTGFERGVATVTLNSWKYFSDYVNQQLLDYRTYVYRGQASANWELESSLDRHLKTAAKTRASGIRYDLLENFKKAALGRRGRSPVPMENENSWWALGRHYGLLTPLIDWTESPFVALYFAFDDKDTDGGRHRMVHCLSQRAVRTKSRELLLEYESEIAKLQTQKTSALAAFLDIPSARPQSPPLPPPPETVDIIRPLSDENARLVSQRGLFTRGPDGLPLDKWIKQTFSDESKYWHLIQIRIPNTGRSDCLRFLNRMNINHLTLFPDLYGSAEYCNRDLVIKNY